MSISPDIETTNVRALAPSRMPLFWRIFSYLFMFIVVNLLANLGRVGLDAMGVPSLMSRLVFVIMYIAGVLGLTLFYRQAIDRKHWTSIGLTPLNVGYRMLAGGFALGLLVTGIVFALEFGTQGIRVVGYESGTNALFLLADSLMLGAAFGVTEEICMRGYVFQNINETRTMWQATLVTGMIFGAFHLLSLGLGMRGASFFIFALMLNAFLVFTRQTTDSLWMAIGFHTAFDWAAINLGLGSVVLADQHLMRIERKMNFSIEDLLATVVVGLVFVLLVGWLRRRSVEARPIETPG